MPVEMEHSTRVNVLSQAINAKSIKKEELNGREVYRVSSATLPDDITMNEIFYPASEIAASFATLERTPAPLGHPTMNGNFLSALDPEAINANYVGAFNVNVRQENGRVLIDKIVDIETANQSENGRRLLAALDNGDAIHTSTGLLCNLVKQQDGTTHATNMYFDHDAILLDDEGAATPDQGVGMLVNGQQIAVINSAVDQAEERLDYSVTWLVEALEQHEKAGFVDRFKETLLSLFRSAQGQTETSETEENDMTDEQLNALSARVDGFAEALGNIGETVANALVDAMKPVNDRFDAMDAAANEATETKKALVVEKIVKANLLDEDVAKSMTLPQLNALAAKMVKGKAANLNTSDGDGGDSYVANDYDPMASLKTEGK